MTLAWHMAKKDVRRLAVPVGVWLLLILLPTLAFRVVSPSIEGHAASSIDLWRGLFGTWMRLLEGVQLFIGFVLVGFLVLEDPLLGTNSFWTTRPIPNGRLFAAKLIAVVLLFFVAPIIVLTPVWLASGFNLIDLVQAGARFAARFGVGALFALMTASVARTPAQFLFCAIVIVGAFSATGLIPGPFWRPAPMAVRASREWIVLAGALPAMAVVLTHQFLSRRLVRTWVIIGGALVTAALIRCAWPWDLRTGMAARHAVAPRAEDHAADIVAAPAFTRHSPKAVPSLYGKTSWRPDGFSVPVVAHLADGTVAMRADRNGMWQSEAGLRALGLKKSTEPLWWQLQATGLVLPAVNTEAPQFAGTLEAWSIRTRVLGEAPVRVGAELNHGPTRARIIQLVSHEDRLDNIYLEERDTHVRWLAGWAENRSRRENEGVRYIDCFFLVNRATQEAQAAHAYELASVELNSLVIRFCNVGVGWRRDQGEPVLVKVRYERDHAFDLPLEVRGMSSQGVQQIP